MHLQDLFSSLNIRSSNHNLPVKTSRTQDGRIQNIHTVGSSHNDDSFIYTKTIHLYQQLIQCLLSLIVSAAHTGTTSSCNCVNLIDKDDTWSILFCFFKQITHTGCTHTYEHFHKIRT